MYTLEFEHVTKRYVHEVVVDDLTFTARPGRVTGFLGPNGAGKSTAMKILLDLAKAEHGTATIGGMRYRDLRDPARTVGVVLEPNAFHPGRSGRNHLLVLADGAGIDPSRVTQMLVEVGLSHTADRRVGGYSLGMRQRLGLAAALLGDPPVLVLDEPGNGLDPQGIRWLRDLLRKRAAAGGTVLVSSHLLAEVEHLADEVVVISRGQLVAAGTLSALQQTGTTVRTPTPDRLTEILTAAGATVRAGRGWPPRRPGRGHHRDRQQGLHGRNRTARAHRPDRLPRGTVPGLDEQRPYPHRRSRLRRCVRDREAGSTGMSMLRLLRAEIRKLTTTKLPWGFLAVLVVVAGLDAAVVAFGTDMNGSKAFVATAADQQSLMAFAFNAMIGTSLFGAIATAREYGHKTVVPTYLTSPSAIEPCWPS